MIFYVEILPSSAQASSSGYELHCFHLTIQKSIIFRLRPAFKADDGFRIFYTSFVNNFCIRGALKKMSQKVEKRGQLRGSKSPQFKMWTF